MVVLWWIGNLELAATAQVDELAREPKSVYHEPWPGRYQPSGTCRQTHHSVTKEVLWLACQQVDPELAQVGPMATMVFMALPPIDERNGNSDGNRMPVGMIWAQGMTMISELRSGARARGAWKKPPMANHR